MTAVNATTSRVIAAAIEVHRGLGPGLLEPLYEQALSIELQEQGISHDRQLSIPAYYKGHLLGAYRVDLLVEGRVLVEVKSVAMLSPVFEAQVLTYLRLTRNRVGLLINFNSAVLRDGIRRLIL